MELVLDRKLSERRIFPAIDIQKSSTRREDLLLTPEEAVARPDITNMSRAILNAYISDRDNILKKGEYRSISLKAGEYEIFGV